MHVHDEGVHAHVEDEMVLGGFGKLEGAEGSQRAEHAVAHALGQSQIGVGGSHAEGSGAQSLDDFKGGGVPYDNLLAFQLLHVPDRVDGMDLVGGGSPGHKGCGVLWQFGAHFGELLDQLLGHQAAHNGVGAHAGNRHRREQAHVARKQRGTHRAEIHTTVGQGRHGFRFGIQLVLGEIMEAEAVLAGELFLGGLEKRLPYIHYRGMLAHVASHKGQVLEAFGLSHAAQRQRNAQRQGQSHTGTLFEHAKLLSVLWFLNTFPPAELPAGRPPHSVRILVKVSTRIFIFIRIYSIYKACQ